MVTININFTINNCLRNVHSRSKQQGSSQVREESEYTKLHLRNKHLQAKDKNSKLQLTVFWSCYIICFGFWITVIMLLFCSSLRHFVFSSTIWI